MGVQAHARGTGVLGTVQYNRCPVPCFWFALLLLIEVPCVPGMRMGETCSFVGVIREGHAAHGCNSPASAEMPRVQSSRSREIRRVLSTTNDVQSVTRGLRDASQCCAACPSILWCSLWSALPVRVRQSSPGLSSARGVFHGGLLGHCVAHPTSSGGGLLCDSSVVHRGQRPRGTKCHRFVRMTLSGRLLGSDQVTGAQCSTHIPPSPEPLCVPTAGLETTH